MQAYLVTIVCTFGGDPAICLREETICAKVYRQTDGRTDDGRRATALALPWNELKKSKKNLVSGHPDLTPIKDNPFPHFTLILATPLQYRGADTAHVP